MTLCVCECSREDSRVYVQQETSYLQQRGPTIGEGGDTTIPSPGRSPEPPLQGIGLHDPLHGRQACPNLIAFDEGVRSNMSPVEAIFVPFLPKTGTNLLLPPPPPQSLNGSAVGVIQYWEGTPHRVLILVLLIQNIPRKKIYSLQVYFEPKYSSKEKPERAYTFRASSSQGLL